MPLDDVLWAGRTEPRILELLPAIVLKRPRLLVLPAELPDDLDAVLRAVRTGRDWPSFRGVEPHRYLQWIPRVGVKGKTPTSVRTYRFRPDDLALIHALRQALPARSDTEVLRIALRALSATHIRDRGAG